MATGTATTTTLSDAVKTLYERKLLTRAQPRLLHTRWAEKPILTNYGSLEWRKYPALAAKTSALAEATTPAPDTVTVTKVTVTPVFYGSFLRHSDQLELTSYDPIVAGFSDLLGEQCGLSLDTIARDNYVPSATVRLSGVAATRGALAKATDKISYNDIVNAIGALMAQNALPMENGNYVAIIHPYTWATMLSDSTIRTVFSYAQVRGDSNPALKGYIGSFMQCDWYVTSNAKVYAGQGAGPSDVYVALFLGKESLGIASIQGATYKDVDMAGTADVTRTGQQTRPVDLIVKPLGSAGTEDPLNQRGTIAWKASQDSKVLNAYWMVALEHVTNF